MIVWASWSTRQVVLHRHRDRQDQLARLGRDDDPADDQPGRGPAEELHEAVVEAGHLGPGVAGQRQHDRRAPAPCRVHVGLGDADGGQLRVGEHVGGDGAQPQRRDRLAERVPHRDPALHGGDAGQRQHAGAVAGGVDAGHVGARHPVDGDVAAGGRRSTPYSREPQRRPCCGTEPTAISTCEPSTVRPSASSTTTPPSVRRTAAARELLRIVMPRARNTRSIAIAASASSCGMTRSRLETSVTSTPIARYALANSAPVTPEPTTIRCSGSSGRSYTWRQSRIRSPSGTAVGQHPRRGAGGDQHRRGRDRRTVRHRRPA